MPRRQASLEPVRQAPDQPGAGHDAGAAEDQEDHADPRDHAVQRHPCLGRVGPLGCLPDAGVGRGEADVEDRHDGDRPVGQDGADPLDLMLLRSETVPVAGSTQYVAVISYV